MPLMSIGTPINYGFNMQYCCILHFMGIFSDGRFFSSHLSSSSAVLLLYHSIPICLISNESKFVVICFFVSVFGGNNQAEHLA